MSNIFWMVITGGLILYAAFGAGERAQSGQPRWMVLVYLVCGVLALYAFQGFARDDQTQLITEQVKAALKVTQ